jgi:hypothetical protein
LDYAASSGDNKVVKTSQSLIINAKPSKGGEDAQPSTSLFLIIRRRILLGGSTIQTAVDIEELLEHITRQFDSIFGNEVCDEGRRLHLLARY